VFAFLLHEHKPESVARRPSQMARAHAAGPYQGVETDNKIFLSSAINEKQKLGAWRAESIVRAMSSECDCR